jgi:predicted enzyme related to lactoylglutathione lyase
MGQPVSFFEIMSEHPSQVTDFYTRLFDWNVSVDPDMDGYGLVDTGAGETAITGGIGPASSPEGAGVKIYVRVEDLDAALARAESLGAKRLLDPMDLPGEFGRIAVVADPDGNPLGLWV